MKLEFFGNPQEKTTRVLKQSPRYLNSIDAMVIAMRAVPLQAIHLKGKKNPIEFSYFLYPTEARNENHFTVTAFARFGIDEIEISSNTFHYSLVVEQNGDISISKHNQLVGLDFKAGLLEQLGIDLGVDEEGAVHSALLQKSKM